MSEPKEPQSWKKGDAPRDIGWDEDPDEAPRAFSADEKALHEENMAKLNRVMRAYGILKIGVTALVVVLIIKLFGR